MEGLEFGVQHAGLREQSCHWVGMDFGGVDEGGWRCGKLPSTVGHLRFPSGVRRSKS